MVFSVVIRNFMDSEKIFSQIFVVNIKQKNNNLVAMYYYAKAGKIVYFQACYKTLTQYIAKITQVVA